VMPRPCAVESHARCWKRGSNSWPPHCERVLVGSTDYYTFRSFDIHSTKQPSERADAFHSFSPLLILPTAYRSSSYQRLISLTTKYRGPTGDRSWLVLGRRMSFLRKLSHFQ
jgi:hypothetical protein